MANREKGEIPIEIAGKTYTLVMNTNAMAQLEDVCSTEKKELTFQQILARVNVGSIRHIRAFIWAALQKYHPSVTIEQAGDLVQQAGGLEGFTQQLLALAESTQPAEDDRAALTAGVEANPQTAQAKKNRGIGARSTATPAA